MWDSLVGVFRDTLESIATFTGHDYGLAIVVVTVLVRVVLWPLTHSQISNMRRMQRLQPELQKIQRKFKNDKQRLNEETMRLMREHKANPAYGCLPTLLQLPVLYALLAVLRDFPPIAGKPFLWVPDLSHPDPYYILPVLAGVLTFAQSWMTTPQMPADSPAASTQRTMLYLMPVLFFFLTLRIASGIALYWVVSSALAVLQYWVILRAEPALDRAGSEDRSPDAGDGQTQAAKPSPSRGPTRGAGSDGSGQGGPEGAGGLNRKVRRRSGGNRQGRKKTGGGKR